MYIDTHTHLFSEAFEDDRRDVVHRAIDSGVEMMLLPNIDVHSIMPLYQLVQDFPGHCFPMMGLHPGSVNENWQDDLNIIKEYLFDRKNVAVGEIGMDLYWDTTFKSEQEAAFRKQIEWAKELNLPIVIHAREAFDEIFAVLDEMNDEVLSGVFHCFTGNEEQAKHILNYGNFYLGIGGVVTYKKSDLAKVLETVPLERILLETDAPYLPPVPHRGKRNESSFLLHIVEKVAEIYDMDYAKIGDVTSQNAVKLFNLNR